MPIPASVTLAEVNEALKPLRELLGIGNHAAFTEPGIYIGQSEIRFVVAADYVHTPEGEKPKSLPVRRTPGKPPGHPQRSRDPYNSLPVVIGYGDAAEYGYDCWVEIA